MRGPLAALGFGIAFTIAVAGLGAFAATQPDPWGNLVLIVLAPAMPFLGNRGDESAILLALVMFVVAWTIVGAFIWIGVIVPIIQSRRAD